jgi:hypothetical protein
VRVFALPLHGGVDADVAAGMVVEEEFFDGTGFEFPVLAELEIDLGAAVGLARGVEAIHVGFVLLGAGHGVGDGRGEEAEYGEGKNDGWEHGRISEAGGSPTGAPAAVHAQDPEAQQREENEDKDRGFTDEFGDVVQNIVAHLVPGCVFNFFEAGLVQEIVVEGDAGGPKGTADVGADLGGLFGGVVFI